MPRKHRTIPVEAFGPELLEALVQGAKDQVRIAWPYRLAVRFAQRANMLRKQMLDSNHPQANIVVRTKISVLWGIRAGLPAVDERRTIRGTAFPVDRETPSIVYIRPHDSEFTDALRASGITAKPLSEDLLGDLESTPTDYLDGILGKEKP